MHFFRTTSSAHRSRGRRKRSWKTENKYLRKVAKLQRTIPNWENLFSAQADNERSEQWVRLSVLAAPLSESYAWAIPDSRALRILSSFGPLIEIGAGKGYWGSLLADQGVDIICVDKYVPEKTWMEVWIAFVSYLCPPHVQYGEFAYRSDKAMPSFYRGKNPRIEHFSFATQMKVNLWEWSVWSTIVENSSFMWANWWSPAVPRDSRRSRKSDDLFPLLIIYFSVPMGKDINIWVSSYSCRRFSQCAYSSFAVFPF